ncbi:MAG: hypothetical protein AAGG44_21020, partial [Planctomycetota bacterium]
MRLLIACVVFLLWLPLQLGCRVAADPTADEVLKPVAEESGKSAKLEVDSTEPTVELSVLFLGNSHSTPLPALLEAMFQRHAPGFSVELKKVSHNGFLAEQAKAEYVCEEIRSGRTDGWDFVVLQAQKYSTTGKFTYPIDGALRLAEIATMQDTKVVLYPEFPRRGVDEYARIRKVHESIGEKTAATIAPIGEAWQLA